jgi:hypothetical protein
MRQTKSMTEFVDQNPPDIGYCVTVRAESQRSAIRIEVLIGIKQDIGLAHRRSGTAVEGHREGIRAKGLTEHRVRERNGVQSVAGTNGGAWIRHADKLNSLDRLIPDVEGRRGGDVQGRITIAESLSCDTELELKSDSAPVGPAGTFQNVGLNGRAEPCQT